MNVYVVCIYHSCKDSQKEFRNYYHLLPDVGISFTLSGSNYPCPEQISIVSKMFEPLKVERMLVMTTCEFVDAISTLC